MIGSEKDNEKEKKEIEQLFHNKTPLNISGGVPISQAFLNKYFLLFSPKQIMFFENLYLELVEDIKAMSMNGEQYFEEVYNSYVRYQKYNSLGSFTPMDEKAKKYVEKFIRKTFMNIKLSKY